MANQQPFDEAEHLGFVSDDEDQMVLEFRDDRLVPAITGPGIDQPGGEVGQIPMDAAVGRAYDAVLEVLRHYRQSTDMLDRIRTRIDKYVIEVELPKWDGEDVEDQPPHDPAEAVDQLVDALERFYGTVLEGVLMKQEVDAFLQRVSYKVNLIPGCLIAIINLENDSKLVELLKMLHHLTAEIREKVFDHVGEQMKKFHDKLLINVDSETHGTVEEIFNYIANKAYVMINLRQLDMIKFLKDNCKALNIVIQIRIVSAHTTSSKTSVKEPAQFIRAFNGHAQVENTLREIPQDPVNNVGLQTEQIGNPGSKTHGGEAILIFSKLPGMSMTIEECKKYLAQLVAKALAPGGGIRHWNISHLLTDDKTQKTYRTGGCAFSELEHCRKVMDKLQTLTSIAEGFEKEELLITWGSSEELESYPQRPEQKVSTVNLRDGNTRKESD